MKAISIILHSNNSYQVKYVDEKGITALSKKVASFTEASLPQFSFDLENQTISGRWFVQFDFIWETAEIHIGDWKCSFSIKIPEEVDQFEVAIPRNPHSWMRKIDRPEVPELPINHGELLAVQYRNLQLLAKQIEKEIQKNGTVRMEQIECFERMVGIYEKLRLFGGRFAAAEQPQKIP